MEELVIDAEEFSQLKRGFMGGHTHANANHVDEVLNGVASYDIISSYPSVMLLEKFPMSRSHKVESLTDDEFRRLIATKACLFDITFVNIRHRLKHEHPISYSKCFEKINAVLDNGRIVSADRLSITITELDFLTYSEFYDWDEFYIRNFRYYEKQYLPKSFAMAILGLYEKKTTLKDVEGEEVNYMISKNMMNAAYGMAVTSPVRDVISYEGDEYMVSKPDLVESIEKYNNDKKRFLFYPWGVWVTAYARRNLFKAIKELGEDYVYADTDSTKFLNPEEHFGFFEEYNKGISDKIARAANFYRVPPERFSPLNKNAKPKTIGIWEYEGKYNRFKTLGAKRYLYEKEAEKDGKRETKLVATVSGAEKTKLSEFLKETGDPFGSFRDGLEVPEEYSGRRTHSYIDNETSGIIVDYTGIPYDYEELSSLHIEPSKYEMSLANEFIEYLLKIKNTEGEL